MPSRKSRVVVPLPTREQLLEFIRANPGDSGKREIARAFHLSADQKPALRRLLREMEEDGVIERGAKRRFHNAGDLPEVTVVEITGVDDQGEPVARPVSWAAETPPPVIYLVPERGRNAALGRGERALVRLSPSTEGSYQARIIRRVGRAPDRVLGVIEVTRGETRLRPTDRRYRNELQVVAGDISAAPGDLVLADILPGRRLGLRKARVAENLGATMGPASISLIECHNKDIPLEFSGAALAQAQAASALTTLAGREDLRTLPLVTIDGSDARDFDDAVFAQADDHPGNQEGWQLLVAIADVAHYVRPGDALDRTARERGNSVYFPDRVVPMLPEELSNGWCSLKPNEDRPCLAVRLRIDGNGRLLDHVFTRAVMRSAARLTYAQVQAAHDGTPDETTAPLRETVIAPLYGAYQALARGRNARGVLDLSSEERRVRFDDHGTVVAIETSPRYDSHRLIEEFMITANVAAAQALEHKHMPCMYRVHDQPSLDKLESLRQFLDSLKLRLTKGVLKPSHFNGLLRQVRGTPLESLVNDVVLRSQAQAVYSPDNLGHFGLALRRYAHFTSPIRRYADVLVHRALISGYDLGAGGLPADMLNDKPDGLSTIAEHISLTERRAQAAERGAQERYVAYFLADRVGQVFEGRISGVSRFGLFVTLTACGGDGLVPISTLPDDYYVHDATHHRLTGRRYGQVFRLGDAVEVRLSEASPVTGSLVLEIQQGGRPGKGRKRRR